MKSTENRNTTLPYCGKFIQDLNTMPFLKYLLSKYSERQKQKKNFFIKLDHFLVRENGPSSLKALLTICFVN